LRLQGGTWLAHLRRLAPSDAAPSTLVEGDLIRRMKWMNDAASWQRSGDRLIVRSRPKADFWRKTFYGYITDNGHFFHLTVKGDFIFQARVNGKYAARYDQAGLMVRLNPENWMKCGTEFLEGARHASVVFTRDFSDWSTMSDLSKDRAVARRVTRTRDALEVACSLGEKAFQVIRQGYLVPSEEAEVGILCASPEGNGFACEFDPLQRARPTPSAAP
jgi:regulation of enolase protein 1 (concanavalin A-like superfamily)